jgi:hypothetical protein
MSSPVALNVGVNNLKLISGRAEIRVSPENATSQN